MEGEEKDGRGTCVIGFVKMYARGEKRGAGAPRRIRRRFSPRN